MRCKVCNNIMNMGDDPDTMVCLNVDCPVGVVHPSMEDSDAEVDLDDPFLFHLPWNTKP